MGGHPVSIQHEPGGSWKLFWIEPSSLTQVLDCIDTFRVPESILSSMRPHQWSTCPVLSRCPKKRMGFSVSSVASCTKQPSLFSAHSHTSGIIQGGSIWTMQTKLFGLLTLTDLTMSTTNHHIIDMDVHMALKFSNKCYQNDICVSLTTVFVENTQFPRLDDAKIWTPFGPMALKLVDLSTSAWLVKCLEFCN